LLFCLFQDGKDHRLKPGGIHSVGSYQMFGCEKLAGKKLGVAFCADYFKTRSLFGFFGPLPPPSKSLLLYFRAFGVAFL
jgi:hypothetical protein